MGGENHTSTPFLHFEPRSIIVEAMQLVLSTSGINGYSST